MCKSLGVRAPPSLPQCWAAGDTPISRNKDKEASNPFPPCCLLFHGSLERRQRRREYDRDAFHRDGGFLAGPPWTVFFGIARRPSRRNSRPTIPTRTTRRTTTTLLCVRRWGSTPAATTEVATTTTKTTTSRRQQRRSPSLAQVLHVPFVAGVAIGGLVVLLLIATSTTDTSKSDARPAFGGRRPQRLGTTDRCRHGVVRFLG